MCCVNIYHFCELVIISSPHFMAFSLCLSLSLSLSLCVSLCLSLSLSLCLSLSLSQLGYVKVNLAEYAGVGVGHRKYLLQSYNENKHKPDNSLLNVSINMTKQQCWHVFYSSICTICPPYWG